jgi:hypothetical protein
MRHNNMHIQDTCTYNGDERSIQLQRHDNEYKSPTAHAHTPQQRPMGL